MKDNRAAGVRLATFLLELKDESTFMDCARVEVDTRGFSGDTPLKIAVVRQDLTLVKALLEGGANPNNKGEDDYTPLHHAAGRESIDIVRLLLQYGASNSVIDLYGNIPIDHAVDNPEIRALFC